MNAAVEIMGILNVTPDSFDAHTRKPTPEAAYEHAWKLAHDGADIIDIGAEATSRWVAPITADEEWARLKNFLPVLLQVDNFPRRISIDTRHPETAELALSMGAVILNDVMTFRDPRMIEVAKRYNATCIVRHSPSEARTIKEVHQYQLDDRDVVISNLNARKQEMVAAGIDPSKIILAPGIDLGKTSLLGWTLLELARYVGGGDVMADYSQREFLSTDHGTGKKLPGQENLRFTPKRNLEAAQVAIQAGAKYLRVHHVAEHRALLVAG